MDLHPSVWMWLPATLIRGTFPNGGVGTEDHPLSSSFHGPESPSSSFVFVQGSTTNASIDDEGGGSSAATNVLSSLHRTVYASDDVIKAIRAHLRMGSCLGDLPDEEEIVDFPTVAAIEWGVVEQRTESPQRKADRDGTEQADLTSAAVLVVIKPMPHNIDAGAGVGSWELADEER